MTAMWKREREYRGQGEKERWSQAKAIVSFSLPLR